VVRPYNADMAEIEKIHDNEEEHYKESLEDLRAPLGLVNSMADLYLTFYRMAGGAPFKLRIEAMARIYMAQACMHRLSMGTLAVQRAHHYDSFRNTREAIEAAAYAVHIKNHPHLTRLWRKGSKDDVSYAQYRKAFSPGVLFPKGVPTFGELKKRYDLCAKLSHPSFLASAPSFKVTRNEDGRGVVYPYFHGGPENAFARAETLLWMVDTHVLILKVLELALPEIVVHGGLVWPIHRNAMEASLDVHKAQFKRAVEQEKTKKASSA